MHNTFTFARAAAVLTLCLGATIPGAGLVWGQGLLWDSTLRCYRTAEEATCGRNWDVATRSFQAPDDALDAGENVGGDTRRSEASGAAAGAREEAMSEAEQTVDELQERVDRVKALSDTLDALRETLSRGE